MFTTLWETSFPLLQWGVVIGASAAAAVWDIRSRRIPNLLTGPLFLSGLAWAVWVGSLAGLGESLAACAILAAPYVWLFLAAGGGAGDAKMMGAIGAWLGLANGVAALLCVSLVGAALGVVFMIHRRGLSSFWAATVVGLSELVQRFRGAGVPKPGADPAIKPEPLAKMPYGLAICSGVCLAAIGVGLWRLQIIG